MNHIKLIKNEQEHSQALARLMALMDMSPEANTPESDEMDVLALLIEQYERVAFPMDKPDPIEAIKFRMEQQGLTKKDLIPLIGSAPKVSEVLNGKRSLSLNMIRKLSEGLGLSADILIKAPEQTASESANIDWLAFPLAEMRKRGYFDGFSGTLRELKEYAAERMYNFLTSVPSGLNLQPAMLRASSHLRSNDKETDAYALWAWQVRVLQKANNQPLGQPYRKGTVNLEWMKKVARLSWSSQGPTLAKEYLNNFGIHLVFEAHLPKTYLDGAVCISANGTPVVALTLRHDKLDNFWFTLMHELAHIALHLDGNEAWYLDDLDAEGGDLIEQQADALAQEALIPTDVWSTHSLNEAVDVIALAEKLEISPCIIAGRARHEASDHSMFGTLFREKVKNSFH